MSTYRRVVQTTRLDYHVPAGAPWPEVEKAFGLAYQEVLRAGREPGEAALGSVRLWPADDEIVLSVELQREVVSTEGVS